MKNKALSTVRSRDLRKELKQHEKDLKRYAAREIGAAKARRIAESTITKMKRDIIFEEKLLSKLVWKLDSEAATTQVVAFNWFHIETTPSLNMACSRDARIFDRLRELVEMKEQKYWSFPLDDTYTINAKFDCSVYPGDEDEIYIKADNPVAGFKFMQTHKMIITKPEVFQHMYDSINAIGHDLKNILKELIGKYYV